MSEFWLGAFVVLSGWYVLETIAAGLMLGKLVKIDVKDVVARMMLVAVFGFLALLYGVDIL